MKPTYALTRHIVEEAAIRAAAALLEEWGYEVAIKTSASVVVLITDAPRHTVTKARHAGQTPAQDLLAKLAADVGKYTQYPPCETETK